MVFFADIRSGKLTDRIDPRTGVLRTGLNRELPISENHEPIRSFIRGYSRIGSV